jgi:flavin reductase (DIM6/NTAB) family NADH-FMN oxidoreductase RutF
LTHDAAPSTLFDCLDRAVWLVTAQAAGRRGGLIATFVSEASIAPDLPRVVVGLARQHYTWEIVESSGAFALHLLGDDQLDWVWRFGLKSGHSCDKLEGLEVGAAVTGSPILNGAAGWLDCRVEARLDTGDRTIYLGEIVQSRIAPTGQPLTLKRLLQIAPVDRLSELKALRRRDAELDAAAIRAWRARRSGPACDGGVKP